MALRHLSESCNGFLLDNGTITVSSLSLQRGINFLLLASQPGPITCSFCLNWFLDAATIFPQTLYLKRIHRTEKKREKKKQTSILPCQFKVTFLSTKILHKVPLFPSFWREYMVPWDTSLQWRIPRLKRWSDVIKESITCSEGLIQLTFIFNRWLLLSITNIIIVIILCLFSSHLNFTLFIQPPSQVQVTLNNLIPESNITSQSIKMEEWDPWDTKAPQKYDCPRVLTP